MLYDLGDTLKGILTESIAGVAVSFETPTGQYAPTADTINLFLYDIREDVELRSNEVETVCGTDGSCKIKRAPPRVVCSYLVTAWTSKVTEKELEQHRLLGLALAAFAKYPVIPKEKLKDSLAVQEPLPPMQTAQAKGMKEPSEFWTAIGGRMRASFTVSVTLSVMDVPPASSAKAVRTHETRFRQMECVEGGEVCFRIGGLVKRNDGGPATGAKVSLAEAGLTTSTDADGRYILGPLSAGTYTLSAESGGKMGTRSITVPAPEGEDYDMNLT